MSDSIAYRRGAAWGTAAMLTCFMLINFIDKISLGMVAVPVMAELHLSPSEFGVIAGSFYWLFSVSTVIVGFLANRVPTRLLLLAMGISWAILQLPIAFASSAAAILVCRLLLGAAEGPAFPVSVHSLYKWFPDSKRSLPVAVVVQGAGGGLLLAGLLIPLVNQHWGWRANFVILGVAGALWSVLWLCCGREGPIGAASRREGKVDAADTAERLPYRRMLFNPSVLGVFLFSFAGYWTLGLTMTWLPAYLENGLGFSAIAAGRWFAVVVVTAMPVTIGLSLLSQRLLRGGASSRQARVVLVSLAILGAAALLCVLAFVPMAPARKAWIFAVAGALPPIAIALAPAILAEMVPDRQRASMIAILTAVGNLAGAVAPAVIGRLVQARGIHDAHGYELGFVCGAALLVLAAVVALLWLHPDRSKQALVRLETAAS
ncbi:MFS transporter [Paraburkholderia sacchari]|uniref:MFS transporter n=1 Tax=Paraburkholderia sacchari TaxID=159450 RepID=UPI000543D60E|nr:MFS transporter [Paraburkholderia sacchari]NLP60677.1 MFS transporter [Paraburkholderia sacchari]